MSKRAFDLLAASLGLVVLSPVLLLIALLIRLDSRGPALFRQVRVGRHGVPFRIHKFRTMVASSGTDALLTVGADPRVTRIGRVLRRYKLDELPQLIDVIAGDMSLVGPRPEVPRYVELYPAAVRDKVLSVRPGITDLASLEHMDENTLLGAYADPERGYVEDIMPRKLELYQFYVEHRSFWLDTRILVATILGIFGRRAMPVRALTPQGPPQERTR